MERVGLIQMTSGPEPQENLAYIQQQVITLAEAGAQLVVTPENSLVFGSRADYHTLAEPLNQGQIQTQLSQIAKDAKVFLVVGSMPIRCDDGVTTTSLVFDPNGALSLIHI